MKFIPEHDDERILTEVAAKNPNYLINGFNIDNIILAAWHELYTYHLDREEIHARITAMLDAMYEGIDNGN